MQTIPSEDGHHSRLFIVFLLFTAVVCGALVMVIEVLGSRVVGPFFGVSLFVWTSLITVTLVALALGYWVGGVLADKRSHADMLYLIIMVSGLLVFLIPLMKTGVLKFSQPMGLRTGSLFSTLVLFGPSLALLGCVSPYLVKIAAREMHNIGRTVGSFYALSTLGSVFGTVVTGFYLIAWLGVDQIFYVIGGILILLSTVYFSLMRRKYGVLLLVLLPLLMPAPSAPVDRIQADGTKLKELTSRQSFYGTVKVVDYSHQNNHVRELMIDGLVQGGKDMTNGHSIFSYTYFLQLIPRALHPEGRRCLVVGVGAGLAPVWYERRGVVTDVVDIDPVVVQVARDYFDFRINGETAIEDARYFISRTSHTYDYVLLDVFNGDLTPGHIISQEAFRLVRSRMTRDGVLALNLIGSLDQNELMTVSVVRTLETVFDNVQVYPVFDSRQHHFGNLVIVAYDGERRDGGKIDLDAEEMHPVIRERIRPYFSRTFDIPATAPFRLLTDYYNPIDVYDVWIREEARRNILKTTDLDLLAG